MKSRQPPILEGANPSEISRAIRGFELIVQVRLCKRTFLFLID